MIFNASHQIDVFGAGFTLQILRRITGVESGADAGSRMLDVELGLPASEDCDQRRTREGYQVPLIHDVG